MNRLIFSYGLSEYQRRSLNWKNQELKREIDALLQTKTYSYDACGSQEVVTVSGNTDTLKKMINEARQVDINTYSEVTVW